MNIKNEHVHELAREAARRTGLSQTSVLEQALQEFLGRLPDVQAEQDRERQRRRARADEILAEMHALITDEDRAALNAVVDEMYDENGLPVW
jgi:antitoxin VapB